VSADDIARGETICRSGKYAPPRGQLLGTITAWGLDVYEGSPQQWVAALHQEQESGC
jgi:hypothetical protein